MLANNGGVIRGLQGRRLALAGLLDGEQQAFPLLAGQPGMVDLFESVIQEREAGAP